MLAVADQNATGFFFPPNSKMAGKSSFFSMNHDFLVKESMGITRCVLVVHSSNQCQKQAVSFIKGQSFRIA